MGEKKNSGSLFNADFVLTCHNEKLKISGISLKLITETTKATKVTLEKEEYKLNIRHESVNTNH